MYSIVAVLDGQPWLRHDKESAGHRRIPPTMGPVMTSYNVPFFSPLRSIPADGFIAWRNFVFPFVKTGE